SRSLRAAGRSAAPSGSRPSCTPWRSGRWSRYCSPASPSVALPWGGTSLTALNSVRCLGEDDEVPIDITDPDLPMASVRIEMYVGDDLGGNVADPADRGVEVVGLEPDR